MRGLPVVNIRSDAIAYSISFPGEDLDRHVRVSRRELVVRQAHHERDRLTTSGTGSPRAGQLTTSGTGSPRAGQAHHERDRLTTSGTGSPPARHPPPGRTRLRQLE